MSIVLRNDSCIITGDQSSYEQEGVLLAPIHMDTVACYGSEEKLTDCTYHTDTTEDHHDEDIWINCNINKVSSVPNHSEQPASATNNKQSINATEATSKKSNSEIPTNTIALAVSLVGLAVSIVVTGLLICRMMYKHKRKNGNTDFRWVFIDVSC